MPQLPALLEGTVERQHPLRRGSAGREPDVPRLLDLAGLDASFATRDCREALRRRAAARDACARAGPRAAGLLLDEPTSALDEDARDAVEATLLHLREASGSRPCSSHTTSSRRGGWPTGCCGSTRGGWSARARHGAARRMTTAIHVSLGDVAATLALVGVAVAVSLLASRRSREGHRDRGGALVHPADRDRLRDQLHLRPGQPLVRDRADRRDGRLRRAARPSRAKQVPGRLLAAAAGAGARRRATLGLVVALGVFKPNRAIWSRSAAWW